MPFLWNGLVGRNYGKAWKKQGIHTFYAKEMNDCVNTNCAIMAKIIIRNTRIW